MVGVSELGLDLYRKIGRWVIQKFGFSVDWKLFFNKENISAFRLVFNTVSSSTFDQGLFVGKEGFIIGIYLKKSLREGSVCDCVTTHNNPILVCSEGFCFSKNN